MPEIALAGCTPEPLMSYLKALGVFRLVAEQVDPTARARWIHGQLHIDTKRSPEQLEQFFCESYRPTPIVGPWGGRSGFYPDDSEATARRALDAIFATTDDRFDVFRNAIGVGRRIRDRLGLRKKDDVLTGDNKLRLMRECRNEFPDEVLPWLDAVFVLTEDNAKYPPLLGTGGNEGSGSYVSTFAQTVVHLLVNRKADAGVGAALFAKPVPVRSDVAVGQFAPGAIGGPNSSVGFGGGGGANPWDYLLAMEGTLLFAGAASRRIGADTPGKAAFPFTVDPNPVGYGSASAAEQVRAEIWMPEWDQPTALDELRFLLAEGRAQLGRRQARTTVDFARSVVTLGVSRGLTAFHRYAVVMRNGLSYFATNLGRFPVREVPRARLLDQLDSWLTPLRRMTENDKCPPRFASAVRRIDASMLDVCRYGADPQRMQVVLRAVGLGEAELANGAKARADYPGPRPLGGLTAAWLSACDDGSAEFRLAVSLTFMSGARMGNKPFRMYVEPVKPRGKQRWDFDDNASGVVWSNTDLSTNLGAILIRRLQEGGRQGSHATDVDGGSAQHPLWVPRRFRPRLSDVMDFLSGGTDDQKLAELLWALPAVAPKAPEFRFNRSQPPADQPVPNEYAVLKLAFFGAPVAPPGADTNADVEIRSEPRALALLRAGRLDEAIELACRRLQVSGLPTHLAGPIGGQTRRLLEFAHNPDRARRLLAALIFPLGDHAMRYLVELAIRKPKTQTL